ncbi:MAG: hypothetical protein ABIW03_05840 [Sphingomicrobium sp.]
MSEDPGARAGGRAGAIAALVAGLVAAAGVAFVAGRDRAPPPDATPVMAKPTLMLLSSLPLVFAEKFGFDGGGSPALMALAMQYRVVPIGVADAPTLGNRRLLLMAHPRAQPAEALVDLDRWVRGGGRLLLLADPMLEWPSERPLGDPLRPPPAFADTGLLKHWGLRLDAPDERGSKQLSLAGQAIVTGSPGSLFGGCAISDHRLVARCRIGKGQATIVADADFLNVDDLDGPTENNLKAVLAELAALDR